MINPFNLFWSFKEYMTQSIKYAGEIVNNIFYSWSPDACGILANWDYSSEECNLIQVPIIIGTGSDARTINMDVSLPKKQLLNSMITPTCFGDAKNLWIYKNHVFVSDPAFSQTKMEEYFLRVKLFVLKRESVITNLKKKVENLEGVFQKKSIRPRISDDVQIAVMARDYGKCVKCDSNTEIQFDHIIPISKGGSNEVENIQILCRLCNQKKSNLVGG